MLTKRIYEIYHFSLKSIAFYKLSLHIGPYLTLRSKKIQSSDVL